MFKAQYEGCKLNAKTIYHLSTQLAQTIKGPQTQTTQSLPQQSTGLLEDILAGFPMMTTIPMTTLQIPPPPHTGANVQPNTGNAFP